MQRYSDHTLQALYVDWQNSKKSMEAFCKERDVQLLQLRNWQRKLKTIRNRVRTSRKRRAHQEYFKDTGQRLVHIAVFSTCPKYEEQEVADVSSH